ncbi:MAG: CPBP family intramembrane metalloprotease [Chloroflexi bacterium]|nr:CPBP family intramembrane metalloprotease [Chloroflexota bacterium]
MPPLVAAIKRYPLVTFFAIAYATSFAGGALVVAYPSDWWALLVYGPCIGALIVTAIIAGRAGVRDWLSRIGRWRVGPQWYLVALGLPVLLRLIAMGVTVLLGAPAPTLAQLSAWPGVVAPEFLLGFLFLGLAEEPGFRGFALPRLLVGRTAVAASLMLGVLHAVWHLPLFISGDSPLAIIPIIISGAILFTWLYNHTRGSVLLAMLMHASVHSQVAYFDSLFTGEQAARQTLVLAAVYVAAALILFLITGPELIRRQRVRTAAAGASS